MIEDYGCSTRLTKDEKMILKDGGLLVLTIIIIAAAIGYGAAKYTKKDDGPIEEAAEQVIKNQIGIDIDLTPDSKE